MTRFFEVTWREDSARLGRLLAGAGFQTPAVLPPGGGDVFSAQSGSDAYFLPPRHPLPQAAHQQVLDEFAGGEPKPPATDAPGAWLVHPNDAAPAPAADVYVLSDAHGLLHDPRRLVEVVARWREELPPDAALYLPAAATPQNALLLVYAGADLLDSTLATLRAHQDLYLHTLGEWPLQSMAGLPCGCRHCAERTAERLKEAKDAERRGFLEAHNAEALAAQVRLAAVLVHRGGLRNAVESQALSSPPLAAALRHLDRHPTYLPGRASARKREPVLACGQDSLHRPEVVLYRHRLLSRVAVPARVVVLLPCSAHKPYSASPSHRRFRRALGPLPPGAREVMVTSPLGAVPRELEAAWPCAHYDAATTGYWDDEEVKVVAGVLRAYLEKLKPEAVVAHLNGGYLRAAELALADLDAEVVVASLDGLHSAVRDALGEGGGAPGAGRRDPWLDAFRCTADYQFRAGAGEALCAGARMAVRQQRRVLVDGRVPLAALSLRTGLLQPTLEGARRLEPAGKAEVRAPWVRIDDFLPTGSVLAPGVADADHEIRPGDEVVFSGPGAFGVGEARMAGWEMARARRGVAVAVREVVGTK